MNIPTSNNTTTDDSTEISSYNIKHIAFLFFGSQNDHYISESNSDNFCNATEYAVYDLQKTISIPILMYDTIKNSIFNVVFKFLEDNIEDNIKDKIEIIPCKKGIGTNQELAEFTNFKKLGQVIKDKEEVDTIAVIFPEVTYPDGHKLSDANNTLIISDDGYTTKFNNIGLELIEQIINANDYKKI